MRATLPPSGIGSVGIKENSNSNPTKFVPFTADLIVDEINGLQTGGGKNVPPTPYPNVLISYSPNDVPSITVHYNFATEAAYLGHTRF